MNKIQKIFLIIGVMSLVFWIFSPLIHVSEGYSIDTFNDGSDSITDNLFDDFELYWWFKNWFQTLSFSLIIGCGLGFHLFKDDKKIDVKDDE